MANHNQSLGASFIRAILAYAFLTIALWSIYYAFWGRHLYTITAYDNCPICINIAKYYDGKFADGKPIYWGGIAADPSVRFGTKIELVPLWLQDWGAVSKLLHGRRNFRVEDRGGKIKGKHLDVFIPDSFGGHKTALKWGVRRMRIKINGEWAD